MSTDQEKVEKILGEPFAMDFSDYVRKIRNNLIITSLISIALLLGGLRIAPDSTFLGLKFTGLDNNLILQTLFFLNAYIFIHFLWSSHDHFQEWWLRLTGTKVAYVTTGRFSAEGADYPSDPRQSTLYNWWNDEARKISSLQEPLNNIQTKLKEWEATITKSPEGADTNVVNTFTLRVSEDVNKLNASVEQIGKTLESPRIPASLKRFDGHFQFFLRSQNLRWLIIELGFPLALGGYALLLISNAL